MQDPTKTRHTCNVVFEGNKTITFSCIEGETILESAERGGWSMPYSCLKGVCMTCEGTLLKGAVTTRAGQIISGYKEGVRFCISRPVSDVEIRPSGITKATEIPVRKVLKSTVYQISQLAKDIYILDLRLPIGVRASFNAGQYLKVYMDNSNSRSYSIANPPHKNQEIQLHIRYIPGGEFSEYFKNYIKKGRTLKIELPYGNFSVKESSNRPVILVATGTGFAPMKSMIENMIFKDNKRSITLYWGTNKPEDMYYMSMAEKWDQEYSWFTFCPVISEPDSDWKGKAGFVHKAVLSDYSSLTEFDVYACGNLNMVTAAKHDFIAEAKLLSENFHCDIFVPTGS